MESSMEFIRNLDFEIIKGIYAKSWLWNSSMEFIWNHDYGIIKWIYVKSWFLNNKWNLCEILNIESSREFKRNIDVGIIKGICEILIMKSK